MFSLDEDFLAMLMQNPNKLEDAFFAGIKPKHLSDGYSKYIYEKICQLHREKSEINKNTVQDFIRKDNDVSHSKKVVYQDFVEKLAKKNVDSSSYTLNRLQDKREELDVAEVLSGAANYLNEHDLENAYAELDKIRSVKSGSSLIQFRDYFDEQQYESRQKEREEIISDTSHNLRMVGRFSFLEKYFPHGIQKQTITTVGGPTGIGKSLMLTNLAELAIHPENKLNILYLIGENREIEATSRLDSVILRKPYQMLYKDSEGQEKEFDFFRSMKKDYGKLYTVKFAINSLTVSDIDNALTRFYDTSDIRFDGVIWDSPDHVRAGQYFQQRYQSKAYVYEEIKAFSEKWDVFSITSLQTKASSAKKDRMTSEDTAGAYNIAQLSDNQIFYLKDEEDFLLNRRRIQLAKLRDAKNDGKTFNLSVGPDLLISQENTHQTIKPKIRKGEQEGEDDISQEEIKAHQEKMNKRAKIFTLNSKSKDDDWETYDG